MQCRHGKTLRVDNGMFPWNDTRSLKRRMRNLPPGIWCGPGAGSRRHFRGGPSKRPPPGGLLSFVSLRTMLEPFVGRRAPVLLDSKLRYRRSNAAIPQFFTYWGRSDSVISACQFSVSDFVFVCRRRVSYRRVTRFQPSSIITTEAQPFTSARSTVFPETAIAPCTHAPTS